MSNPNMKGEPVFEIYRDGDQFMAISRNFVNMQESPCGFGSTPEEAVAELWGKNKEINCGYECGYQEPYGWVASADCPIHD